MRAQFDEEHECDDLELCGSPVDWWKVLSFVVVYGGFTWLSSRREERAKQRYLATNRPVPDDPAQPPGAVAQNPFRD